MNKKSRDNIEVRERKAPRIIFCRRFSEQGWERGRNKGTCDLLNEPIINKCGCEVKNVAVVRANGTTGRSVQKRWKKATETEEDPRGSCYIGANRNANRLHFAQPIRVLAHLCSRP